MKVVAAGSSSPNAPKVPGINAAPAGGVVASVPVATAAATADASAAPATREDSANWAAKAKDRALLDVC